ncbi:crotonase/enoyl-CoA hydratase family protein [Pyruvatibacter mobilis]|uniref:Crotonase/enoyl-CoA hydratase family protein n=1 Tax=Pyruvatibacter mobilis TaxID=1712261 RepID=A0A845Q9J6_9HYPH|nr:crotonase/enoyl-CoA hydratase family protein [Pyruvatibacter mobilis]NBG94771.1 crotonase/enoyl-CoA hydratase family protein [Pyruvatibacter mobilis]QJD75966.1 crotonase/enoyl-CoA hydratase family protein [Pyruvatibacter mobilis]GGD19999.1 enoyl-CoA hydratase [Pyruvatibacter mobilis]
MGEVTVPVSDRDASAEPDGRITVTRQGHVLLMGIDRPEKYNGLTPKMFSELADAFTQLDEDPELRVGVLHSFGKHFTAGLELTKFAEGMKKGDSVTEEKAQARVDPFALKRKCSKPVITAVQGICYTAGIEMMLASDIVIASKDTRFAQLEPRRGLMATGGGTLRFIERCGWGNGMYHLLLCDGEFSADEGLRIGIVQEVVEPGTQVARAIELANRIATLAPLAIQETKRSAMLYVEEGEAAAKAVLDQVQAKLANTEDAAEGVQSFIERRAGNFKGR